MEDYTGGSSGIMERLGVFLLIYAAFIILLLAAEWKIFVKAGKPGWAAIIPIYNFIVILEIVGKPVWWIILMFIPFVNIIFLIIVIHNLSLSFGQGIGMTLLIFVAGIGLIVLGFGDARYVGPPKATGAV